MSTSYTITEPYDNLQAFLVEIAQLGWRKAATSELDAKTLSQGGLVIAHNMTPTIVHFIHVYPVEMEGKTWISMERFDTNSIGSLHDNIDMLSEHDDGFWELPPNKGNDFIEEEDATT